VTLVGDETFQNIAFFDGVDAPHMVCAAHKARRHAGQETRGDNRLIFRHPPVWWQISNAPGAPARLLMCGRYRRGIL